MATSEPVPEYPEGQSAGPIDPPGPADAGLRPLTLNRLMDQALLDRAGRRAGRVDDLILDFQPGHPPRLALVAIVSGPLARPLAAPLRLLARCWYRLVGVRDARPAVIDWCHVDAIDALIHLDVDRDRAGLRPVDAAAERLIARIPYADREATG